MGSTEQIECARSIEGMVVLGERSDHHLRVDAAQIHPLGAGDGRRADVDALHGALGIRLGGTRRYQAACLAPDLGGGSRREDGLSRAMLCAGIRRRHAVAGRCLDLRAGIGSLLRVGLLLADALHVVRPLGALPRDVMEGDVGARMSSSGFR